MHLWEHLHGNAAKGLSLSRSLRPRVDGNGDATRASFDPSCATIGAQPTASKGPWHRMNGHLHRMRINGSLHRAVRCIERPAASYGRMHRTGAGTPPLLELARSLRLLSFSVSSPVPPLIVIVMPSPNNRSCCTPGTIQDTY